MRFTPNLLALCTDSKWSIVCLCCLITARKRILRRLCFHRCLSVHRRGVCLPHCMLGYPPRDQRQTPPWADTPRCSACWYTVNKRAVHIPVECILVHISFDPDTAKVFRGEQKTSSMVRIYENSDVSHLPTVNRLTCMIKTTVKPQFYGHPQGKVLVVDNR